MTATAERLATATNPTGSENLCPGCGPVGGMRSFYCRVHIADLWRQVWDHRPESGPQTRTAGRR